jgi:hypothetical protein
MPDSADSTKRPTDSASIAYRSITTRTHQQVRRRIQKEKCSLPHQANHLVREINVALYVLFLESMASKKERSVSKECSSPFALVLL